MSNKKILIVEDDADMRLALNVRLRAHHYDVCFAADATMSIMEARKQQPDLILLDLGLPGGDGFVVMQRLQSMPQLAVIPVVVVSARDQQANEERALRAGARAFLQKPVDNDRLLQTIREVLGEG